MPITPIPPNFSPHPNRSSYLSLAGSSFLLHSCASQSWFSRFVACKSQVPVGHIFIFAWTIDLYINGIAVTIEIVFFGGSECLQLFLLCFPTIPRNNRGVFQFLHPVGWLQWLCKPPQGVHKCIRSFPMTGDQLARIAKIWKYASTGDFTK